MDFLYCIKEQIDKIVVFRNAANGTEVSFDNELFVNTNDLSDGEDVIFDHGFKFIKAGDFIFPEYSSINLCGTSATGTTAYKVGSVIVFVFTSKSGAEEFFARNVCPNINAKNSNLIKISKDKKEVINVNKSNVTLIIYGHNVESPSLQTNNCDIIIGSGSGVDTYTLECDIDLPYYEYKSIDIGFESAQSSQLYLITVANNILLDTLSLPPFTYMKILT